MKNTPDQLYKKLLSRNEFLAVDKFIEYLKQSLKDNLITIKIFGSKARGESKNDSDIDIFVLVREMNYGIIHNISGVASELNLEFNIVLSPLIFSLEEDKKNRYYQTLFIKSLDKEGILLYGKL
ncbi:MAG: nucleotidyltransferase domain-containing protein [bacterium]